MKKILSLTVYFLFLFVIGAKAQTTPPPVPPDVDLPQKADSSQFRPVEQVPEFPGGIEKFYLYLKGHFRLPPNSGEITGRVIVSFVVEKDGSLTDVKVVRGLSPDIDKEAIRVILNSPKWKPGIQNGKAVRVAYSVPIPVNGND